MTHVLYLCVYVRACLNVGTNMHWMIVIYFREISITYNSNTDQYEQMWGSVRF